MPLAIFPYARKSTEPTSNAQPGEAIVMLIWKNARFFKSPTFGPTAAWKLSKMRVNAELSVANAVPTDPARQLFPSCCEQKYVRTITFFPERYSIYAATFSYLH